MFKLSKTNVFCIKAATNESQVNPLYTVYRKPSNFSFILSKVVVYIVRIRINAIRFIFFDADVRTFETRMCFVLKRLQIKVRWNLTIQSEENHRIFPSFFRK